MPRASIQFHSAYPRFKLSHPRKTASWLKAICQHEHQALGALSYVFCSDEHLLSLNKEFLQHSTYTDILSFDDSESGMISGEIYISIPRVKENAARFDQAFEVELRRVIAHGLLHFLGYQDKSPGQKAQMRQKEEACLSLWK